MQEKLSFTKKLVLLLSIISALILYISYFYLYLGNGEDPYQFSFMLIIGSILLICYFGLMIFTYLKLEKSLINLLIGIIGIILVGITLYLYFNFVNIASIVYLTTILFVFISLYFKKIISKEKLDLNCLIGIAISFVFLIYSIVEVINKKDSSAINTNLAYLVLCLFMLFIISYTKYAQLFRQIWIGLACLCFLAVAIMCRINLTSIDQYKISVFLTIMAIGLVLIRAICKISYPDTKEKAINLIINTVSIIIVFIVLFPIKNTKVENPSEISLINPYRIIALSLIVLYIIDELFEYISKKSLPGCFVLSFSILSYLFLAVVMFIDKEASYHIFYSYYLSTVIILIIEVLCLTIYKSIFFKQQIE